MNGHIRGTGAACLAGSLCRSTRDSETGAGAVPVPIKELDGFRISVRLDAGLPVEALIVKRLIALPKRRHQDWIRALLVQGFVAESRVHRQVQIGLSSTARGAAPAEKAVALPTSAYANWRREPATRHPSSRRALAERTPPAPTPSAAREGSKPFTQLAKVIG